VKENIITEPSSENESQKRKLSKTVPLEQTSSNVAKEKQSNTDETSTRYKPNEELANILQFREWCTKSEIKRIIESYIAKKQLYNRETAQLDLTKDKNEPLVHLIPAITPKKQIFSAFSQHLLIAKKTNLTVKPVKEVPPPLKKSISAESQAETNIIIINPIKDIIFEQPVVINKIQSVTEISPSSQLKSLDTSSKDHKIVENKVDSTDIKTNTGSKMIKVSELNNNKPESITNKETSDTSNKSTKSSDINPNKAEIIFNKNSSDTNNTSNKSGYKAGHPAKNDKQAANSSNRSNPVSAVKSDKNPSLDKIKIKKIDPPLVIPLENKNVDITSSLFDFDPKQTITGDKSKMEISFGGSLTALINKKDQITIHKNDTSWPDKTETSWKCSTLNSMRQQLLRNSNFIDF
jgi:hypothetical protein